jgi:hypothetical protein
MAFCIPNGAAFYGNNWRASAIGKFKSFSRDDNTKEFDI